VLSFIRAVDRFTITGTAETMPSALLQLTLVVMARSGSHRGSGQITLTPTTPSGEQMPPIAVSVVFEGDDDRGVGIVMPLGFPVAEPGAYWFTVALDGCTLTRTAFRVVYMKNSSLHGS
jgi:hypothetical protein